MKNKIILVLLSILLVFAFGCSSKKNKPPYPLKEGSYNFRTAKIINKISKEENTKSFDEIIENEADFHDWGNLLSFNIIINEDTEYFYNKNKKCYVLNEGIAFEVIAENTLQLHLPDWTGYDFYTYDILITLSFELLYF